MTVHDLLLKLKHVLAGDGPAPRMDDEYKSFLAELGGGPGQGAPSPAVGPGPSGMGAAASGRMGGPGLGMPGEPHCIAVHKDTECDRIYIVCLINCC